MGYWAAAAWLISWQHRASALRVVHPCRRRRTVQQFAARPIPESSLVARSRKTYDPEAAEELLRRQPTRWVWRNVRVFLPLAAFVANVALDVSLDREEERRSQRAGELRQVISDLGPAIIKAGQALASRPDLLPAEYLKELQKLQDQVPPFPTEVALQRVETSLSRPFDEIYELLQETPVAAASIGQVYQAKLKATGQVVALKVQRPGCEQIIALDLFVLRWWARQIRDVLKNIFKRDIDLVSVIDDFGEIIYREIDYVAEAENAQKFADLYESQVKVPKIYPELTTADVLTMEWIDGTRLVDGDELKRVTGDADTPARLVDTLVQCSLRQMLDSGFFHADPHAGNLLATPDGQLCYLDFGMMSYLEESQRLSIIEAVVHLVNRDFENLAKLYVRMGFIKSDVDVAPIVDGLAAALPDVLDASVAELNVKNVVNRLGDVMYTFPFRLPPYYVAIIRCLGVLEGVAIQVDPQFRIVSDAYPYIAARLLTDESPELRAALNGLLFKDGRPQWARFEALLDRASGSDDYDAARVVDVLVDLVADNKAARTRANLVVDVVDALDHLGTDAARNIIKLASGIDLPPPPPLMPNLLPDLLPPAPEHANGAILPVSSADLLSSSSGTPPPATHALVRAAEAVQARSVAVLADPQAASKAVSSLQSYIPLAQRISNEPALRQMAAEVAAEVAERAASRAIRLALLPLAGPPVLTPPQPLALSEQQTQK